MDFEVPIHPHFTHKLNPLIKIQFFCPIDIYLTTPEVRVEFLSFALMLSAIFLIMFGSALIRGFIHSNLFNQTKLSDQTIVGGPLSGSDKGTLFLRKNWVWVILAVALCIGLILALFLG